MPGEWLPAALGALKLRAWVLFSLAAIGGAFYYCADPASAWHPFAAYVAYQPWGAGALLGFGILGLGRSLNDAGKGRAARKAIAAGKESILRNLDALSGEEWLVLLRCVRERCRSIALPLDSLPATCLYNKGLLQLGTGFVSGHAAVWTIPQFVWEHLNSPLIYADIEKQLQQPQVIQALEDFHYTLGPGSYYS